MQRGMWAVGAVQREVQVHSMQRDVQAVQKVQSKVQRAVQEVQAHSMQLVMQAVGEVACKQLAVRGTAAEVIGVVITMKKVVGKGGLRLTV